METIAQTKPMTDRQRSFMRSLLAQKFDADTAASHIAWLDNHSMSTYRASAKIDELMKLPDAAGATDELEIGMYQIGDDIYKVQRAVHGSGNLYAKRLTEDGFEYATGAIRKIKPEHRMSIEAAKAYGKLTGTCCSCGRTLTDENSIAEGIGPVCAGKF